jgi:cyclophilin family peptidyl-prolyl cis-trans isomerase
LSTLLTRLADAYPDTIQIVYRHFPLVRIHPNATKAAEAAEAAGSQGMFWEYHDLLFEKQSEYAGVSEEQARTVFIGLAEELDLDVETFTAELDDGVHAPKVNAQRLEAEGLGMPGTPSVILDGQLLVGDQLPPTYFYWDAYIKLAMLRDQQYDGPPPSVVTPDTDYYARVEMASGDSFVIELYPDVAPETVNSFVFLANEGWFDGNTFHRVLDGFIAQTGDPTATGFGGPGYYVPDEIDADLTHAVPGMVAMANAGPGTAGSQWYITLSDVSQLDGSYTIFGKVIQGFDVVEALPPRDPVLDPEAAPGAEIRTIEILNEAP